MDYYNILQKHLNFPSVSALQITHNMNLNTLNETLRLNNIITKMKKMLG